MFFIYIPWHLPAISHKFKPWSNDHQHVDGWGKESPTNGRLLEKSRPWTHQLRWKCYPSFRKKGKIFCVWPLLTLSYDIICGHPSSALVISCKIAPMTLLLFKRCNFRKQSQSWGERVNAFFYQVATSTNLRFLSSNVRNHFYYYHDVNHKGKLLLLSKVLFWPRPLLE